MTQDTVISIFQQTLELLVLLISMMLLPALAVGLLVSMFQAATQINEQTLSFIPKLLVTLATLMLAGPYMLQLVATYTRQLIESIPTFIG
ncbi:MAG: flagellar biosynthesis protein FliQ [Gammaproteobacteria bacterium]|nr:flagellar biosynthesis protein FliQ [Gammaproteobacteria bacterium]